MKKIEKIILATHNDGKISEFQDMMTPPNIPFAVNIMGAKALNLTDPVEDGVTFHQNAAIKAKSACLETGLPALADDSGLAVNALNGDPGVYSADWAIVDETKGHAGRDFDMAMRKVHDALADYKDRSAAFMCVLAFAMPKIDIPKSDKDIEVIYFDGRVDGTIIWPPRGANGFGYDAIFAPNTQPTAETRSFAQMSAVEKKSMSHRGNAMALFLDYFNKQFNRQYKA